MRCISASRSGLSPSCTSSRGDDAMPLMKAEVRVRLTLQIYGRDRRGLMCAEYELMQSRV
jgi:hypothetical protein